ncbi:helix-turn-helix transcriptional regulator [Cohnella zeiphila]|uniref:YafY family transcriptional regulator n=1 Tax=Cohnella zeiphila TaxID=2761120 RepID=A0A7X0SQF1_9BACL|nr:YafY family protein [Cohnella zeiphila]MBB6734240.1 YafY family transcriptional regulator [Cohnella zeiphila]
MKLERLISMVYMLLNHEVVSATALAERYNVSPRTIYRDIEAICAAGIPVVSYQGVNGGFGIMDEYKMDRSLLGAHDVGALVSVLQSMSAVFGDEQAMETAYKLQTIQGRHEKPGLSMEMGIGRADPEALRTLRAAIKDSRVLKFVYISAKGEKTDRVVEPVKLTYRYDAWYLYAYCRTRSDYREFKVPRMVELSATAEPFRHKHPLPPSSANSPREMPRDAPYIDAVLHFSVASLARALDFFHRFDKSFNPDGSLIVKARIYHYPEAKWIVPILLSFGSGVEVLEPAELRQELREQLQKTLSLYAKV